MHITAGENRVPITKQTVRRDNGIGLILRIEVDRESMSIGDLETIVRDICDNALEITVFNDNDEKTQLLSGFHCEPNILIKGNTYVVEFLNASENTYQIGRQRQMIADMEQTIATQRELITSLTKENDVLTNTIEGILLDVIPSVVSNTNEA